VGIEDSSISGLSKRSADYGFQNRDELIGLALGKLQQEFQALEASANLYAEEYAEDADLRALTDSASVGWVERPLCDGGQIITGIFESAQLSVISGNYPNIQMERSALFKIL
jgi:hypothetical protein